MTSVPRPLHRCFSLSPAQPASFAPPTCPEEELSTAASCTLVSRLSSATIVELVVRPGQVVCVLDNGVLEAYRFALSDTAKFILDNRKRDGTRDGVSASHSDSDSNGAFIEDNGLGNLISFDDFDSSAQEPGRSGECLEDVSLVQELEGGADSGYAVSMVDTPPPKLRLKEKLQSQSLAKTRRPSSSAVGGAGLHRDVLVAVEKELLHADHLQRLPLSRPPRQHKGTGSHRAHVAGAAPLVHCSSASGLVFCYGRVDGGVRPLYCSIPGSFFNNLCACCVLCCLLVVGGGAAAGLQAGSRAAGGRFSRPPPARVRAGFG